MSSILFSPVDIGTLTLRNRIVIAPMCQYSSEDGLAGDWHLMHYGSLSHSGAGLLVFEATAVTPEGRISPSDLGLWSDAQEEALAKVFTSIRKYSSMPMCLQIAHAGRKASQFRPWDGEGVVPAERGGWMPEAPSALMYKHGPAGGVTPKAMQAEDLERVKQAFSRTAERAARIGFDMVELHAAHGYLLHEFLSPLSNMRDDRYGGSLENRMRYPLEVFGAVRAAFPADRPVGVRISGSDWADGGWTVAESGVLSSELQKRGSAYVHVSGGGLSVHQSLRPGPGYQADMAASIRKKLQAEAEMREEAPAAVIAVGLITEPEQAETILVSGQADLISLGRAMLFNPRWPWHAAAKLRAEVVAPPQYWRAAPYGVKDLFKK